MEFKHNKKRNVGLLSEFFSRYISEAFLDGRMNDISMAKKIWDKHVHPKSETYKELQTFNALHESTLQTKEVAFNLISSAKNICQNQKQSSLDYEKDLLIKEINEKLNDKRFFDRNVSDYKTYASVQLLMNAWRGTGFKGGLSDIAQLEESVLNHILKQKNANYFDASTLTNDQVDGLVVKIMTEKFNQKYSNTLNDTQKSIVKYYTLSEKNENQRLVSLLEILKNDVVCLIKKPIVVNEFESPLRKKLNNVLSLLENEYSNVSAFNDDMITFYMSIAKLKEELETKV